MTHAAPAAFPSLPADVAALRALALETMAERDAAVAERNEAAAECDALATQNDRLRHLLVKLQTLQFGKKSERLPEEQLQLGLEDLETVIAQGGATAEKRDPDLRHERTATRRANRGALPAHLPGSRRHAHYRPAGADGPSRRSGADQAPASRPRDGRAAPEAAVGRSGCRTGPGG